MSLSSLPPLAKHSDNGLKLSNKGPSQSYLRSNISNIFRTLKYIFIWGQGDLLKTIVGITFGFSMFFNCFIFIAKGSEEQERIVQSEDRSIGEK